MNPQKTLPTSVRRLLAGITLLMLVGFAAQAQIDPVPRQLLQLGVNSSLHDQGPMGAYAFYYWNMPNVPTTNEVLRFAIAPVYIDSDLGFKNLLGDHTDLAVGAFGGLYANSYQEVDSGDWKKDQSFDAANAGARVSIYHLLNPGGMIPLTLVLRESVNYVSFMDSDNTSERFELPQNQPILTTRAGFRWGGKEPILTPKLAMEVSGWYEMDNRTDSGSYGYNDSYRLESVTQRIFGRVSFNYLTLETHNYITFSLQGGVDLNPDRIGCFRLGGMLPYTKEFPLLLPGYYYQELSAKSFGLVNLGYGIPIDAAKNITWFTTGAAALVDYMDGTGQPGAFNSGVGTGLGYTAPSRRWKLLGQFGYGFEAERSNGRGGYSLGFAFQYNFGHVQSDSDKAWEELEKAEGTSGASYSGTR
jgi:hypothetical protein